MEHISKSPIKLIDSHKQYLDRIFDIFRAYHLRERYRESEHIREWAESWV
jgi:hypothetical protein